MILNPQQIFLMRLGQPIIPANDSGGSSAPTHQQVTQTNVPEYARPYVEDTMAQAKAISGESYMPYAGPRVADQTNSQKEALRRMRSMSEGQDMYNASGILGAAADGAFGTTGYQAGDIYSTYNPNGVAMFGRPNDVAGTFDAGEFTGDAVSKYMSPYMDNVTNATVREMDRRHAISGTERASQAVGAGAFGGSRAALVEEEARRNNEMAVGDVMAKGRQSAFENAQSQFERDRQARYNESGQDLDAAKYNVNSYMQHGLAGLDASKFNETQQMNASKMDLEAMIAQEQARAGAAGIQQKGYAMAGEMGGQLGQLGSTRQEMEMQRLMGLDTLGSKAQATTQAQYDTAYDDFVNQRDHQRNNLSYYSSIVRGMTPQMNSDTVTRQAAPSATTQTLGLGLGALGAMGMYGK